MFHALRMRCMGSERASTPEEHTWREARRAADARLRLTGEALRFGVFAVLALVFWRAFVWLTPLMLVVLVLWAARLARHFYRLQIAPELRERFLEEEIEKRVNAPLHRERREMEFERAAVRMADVVESAVESFRERLARARIELATRIDSPGMLFGDAEKLRRIVIDLIGNAVDALSGAAVPRPRIELEMGENLAGSEVWLRVRDNGPGNRTGPGLATTRKVVELHGGEIEVASEPGAGAQFLVTLPVQAGQRGETA